MASDDAADLLLEIDQARRLPLLNLLPPAKQTKIRALLGHNPSTAGGLMNPDFVSVGAEATVAEALAAVRASELGVAAGLDDLPRSTVHGLLVGAVSLADLVRAEPRSALSRA